VSVAVAECISVEECILMCPDNKYLVMELACDKNCSNTSKYNGAGDSSPELQQVYNLNDVAGLLKAATIAFATCASTHVPGIVRPQSHGIPGLGRPENEVDNSSS